jgi:hypothetical protein
MIRRCATRMMALLAALAAGSAWAAEDVYHRIPSDALAFVAVNHIAETSAKVQKLAGQVGAPPVSLLDMAKQATSAGPGLDDTRAAAVVIMPNKEAKGVPIPVFLIPVTDYKQFIAAWQSKPAEKEAKPADKDDKTDEKAANPAEKADKTDDKITEITIAGEPMLVAQCGHFAAISSAREDPRDFRSGLEKLLAAKRSVADEHPQALAWWAENNAVAVATSHGIKLASQTMQEEMEQMRAFFAQMEQPAGMSPVTVMEMYLKVLQWAEKEVDLIGLAARVDKQGDVHVTAHARFTKTSGFSSAIAQLKPLDKGVLAGMPAGPFVLAGGGPWSDAITSGIVSFQSELTKQAFQKAYGLSEKQADELAKKTLDAPKGVRSMAMMLGTGQPGEPIFGDVLGLYHVDNAEKYLDAYQTNLDDLSKIGKQGDKPEAKKLFVAKRTKVGDRPAVENEMPLPATPQTAALPDFGEKMGKLFGAGGTIKTLLVAIDEHTVALSFSGRAPLVMQAIAAAKHPKDSLASDPGIAKAAALLPAGAQWTGYFSPSGAVAFAKWCIDTLAGEGEQRPNIPDFPASPPIAVAAKALPGELQIEAIVPSAVLEAIGKYVGIVQSAEHPEVP